MSVYRIYVLEADGHSVLPPRVIEYPSDQAAIREAQQFLDGKAVEVWQGATRIAKLEPSSE